MVYLEMKPLMGSEPIYGAKWLGTSDPAWIRTDAASLFTDPNPYYAGMSTTPSSPFDTISPWKDMKRVEDSAAGSLVEIPKFYYKWSRPTGYSDGLALQISMHQYDGFLCSPAHADRGDGKGERDVVYVGRYKCASDYKSKTGVQLKSNITRAEFRSGIHNLGLNIWQQDYAINMTLLILYLIEYAHWDCQAKIGGGGGTSYTENSGSTDTMPYHTGTDATSISNSVTGHTQYRYIEGLWDTLQEFYDGIYLDKENSSQYKVYCIKNPSLFSDSSGGTYINTLPVNHGTITAYNISSITGYEYAILPSVTNDSLDDTTYACVTAYIEVNADERYANIDGGGSYTMGRDLKRQGINYFCRRHASFKGNWVGSRLMKLP